MVAIIRCRLIPFVMGILGICLASPARAETASIKILFLGDNGHHRPAERFRQLESALAPRGIELVYTDKMTALNPKTLGAYAGLMLYANIERISPEQETALLDYVASGKGFVPLHCASYCFLNSPKCIELIGAQFQKHGAGVFRTVAAPVDHPILRGFSSFESWDETYVHHKHNDKDRVVLEFREDRGVKEPWTWVRTHGKGRVFYTAWGHDQRTWSHPGFQNLVERGTRWAVGASLADVAAYVDQPKMTALRTDVAPFEYIPAKVPFYPVSDRWGVTADPLTKMQKPLSPAESMKHFVHPVEFDVRLFASEAQLGGKPICMNWDERGRLWAGITMDYPNELQSEGQGRDRIVVCEDTDGDGQADKVTVFADKLSIPTSLTFANGGLVVTQAPHTLFLKDTNGDDVADERRALFTGWGTRDTHAGPSNLQYGLDNWIYGICGYSGFDGTVGGERVRFGQGFFRFRPDGSKLEFLRSTNNNSWGVGFSEEGLLFGSTANGNPSMFLAIPNRHYESVRGWTSSVLPMISLDARFRPITEKVRQVDWHGQFTAGAGHALYTARAYPKDYWNRTAFVTEPTGHLAATFVLQPSGSDFVTHYGWNLIASDDEWCGPIMAEVGPDGNVWILDWYSFIVQHNPTPPGFKTGKGNAYETELRDKKHGRIYRLVAREAKPAAAFSLKGADAEKLVATLRNDNFFWRKHAQRLLVERGQKDVVPQLAAFAIDNTVDAIGLNPGAMHALWTMHGLGAVAGDARTAVGSALRHPSAGVRRNALAVIPRDAEGLTAILGSNSCEHADAQVRLAAFLALAEMPADARAGAILARCLAKPENSTDRWIPDAITSAAARHDIHFLRAVAASKAPLEGKGLEVLSIVAEHYARGGPTDTVGQTLASLQKAPAPTAQAILTALRKGWPRGKTFELTPEVEQSLTQLFTRVSPGAQGQLLALAQTWGSKAFEKHAAAIAKSLLAVVGDDKQADNERASAARQLVGFQGENAEAIEKLLGIVSPRTPPQVAVGIIDAVGGSPSPAVGKALVERMSGWTPASRQAALRTLLSRPDSTRLLLEGVEQGKANLNELALDQKTALAAHPDAKIAERAKKLLASGGSLPNPDRQKVFEQLLPLTKRTGKADLGKVVFKNQCAKCHMHSGEGEKIGPDLTGMAVHTKEHLLADLLDPSRSVEGNFRVYVVSTKDGRVLSGLLASETKTAVELIDAEAKRQVVLRDDIDELAATPKSLMPEGFEKQVSPDDIANLLEFLTQRGKYLPLPLSKAATVVSTRGMFFEPEGTVERMVFDNWGPKTFAGVPFHLVDPQGDRVPNAVLLYGPNGKVAPTMPKSVTIPCNSPAKAVHMLSGVSGWGFPVGRKGSLSMIVRLHYADGMTEDHLLRNGEHFADYVRPIDVPGSKLAFELQGRQLRYLSITPKRQDKIERIELLKGSDSSAPIVMAVTVEGE